MLDAVRFLPLSSCLAKVFAELHSSGRVCALVPRFFVSPLVNDIGIRP